VDYLCESCTTHFDGVRKYLDVFGIPWKVSHRLVRGLDYYTRTTFEILGMSLGAQNALLGGGRYDGLVKDLGGPDRTGIGFAAGMERLVLALPDAAIGQPRGRAFLVAIGDDGRDEALKLLVELRRGGVAAQMEFDARGVRAQMKRADRLQASVSLIVGGDELARGEVTMKDMKSGEQRAVPRADVVNAVREALDLQVRGV
jgi:histidyl-tRNA synthetase